MMKHITLIITGSIVATKALLLYEKLIKTYEIEVVATHSALKFLPVNNIKITSELFEKGYYDKNDEIFHKNIALKTDLIVVFPASMNFISKASLAISDNLALTTFLACPAYKLAFLGMTQQMFNNESFQNNCALLQKLNNVQIIAPNNIALDNARLSEIDEACKIIDNYFENLITVSPSKEAS